MISIGLITAVGKSLDANLNPGNLSDGQSLNIIPLFVTGVVLVFTKSFVTSIS
jgi:hypothetical protein